MNLLNVYDFARAQGASKSVLMELSNLAYILCNEDHDWVRDVFWDGSALETCTKCGGGRFLDDPI